MIISVRNFSIMEIFIMSLVIGALFEFIETNDFDKSQCDPRGIKEEPLSKDNEECKCKELVSGSKCDQCTAETFDLTSENKLGCKFCFCMGVTTNCSSSSWYRNKINADFENSLSEFSLVMPYQRNSSTITQGLRLNDDRRGINYTGFAEGVESDAIYWQLPAVFLGNKLTSYGGELKYTIYYSSSAQELNPSKRLDVIIDSNAHPRIYHRLESTPQPNSLQALKVILLEKFWTSGPSRQPIPRGNFLMILTNIKTIRVRAAYTTRPDVISISDVSLDIATEVNTGMGRALEVEECNCPIGYIGLSCEECATGYRRGRSALYLGNCELDSSNELDEYEFGKDYGTDAEEIDNSGDSIAKSLVKLETIIEFCNCEPAGSRSNRCVEGKCQCKVNVHGSSCNVCRSSTFGLSVSNVNGCNECFCSGVTKECRGSSLFIQSIVPNFDISNHLFKVFDRRAEVPLNNDIEIHSSHEIQYHYGNDRKAVMWSLCSIFIGNQVKSYGGYLEFFQKYESHTVTNFKTRQHVMLKGNGLTLTWQSNDEDLISFTFKNYRVPLRESEWRKRTYSFHTINATRADLMTALSNVEAIFVVAPYHKGIQSVSIKNVSLDTALESPGEDMLPIIATQVEECTCPLGYTGTSCESCLYGYYRDINDLSESVFGRCKPCPCNNREDSCELYGNSQIKCHCAAGYTGDWCQDIVSGKPSPIPLKDAKRELKVSQSYLRLPIGQNAEIDCYIVGPDDPQIKLKWEKRGHSLPNNTVLDNGHLVISHVTKENSGLYTCRARDKDGTQLYKAMSVMKVISGPKILEIAPENQMFNIGATLSILCRVEGDEPITIKWSRDGQPLLSNQEYNKYGALKFHKISSKDVGTYVCNATNEVGSVAGSAEVKLKGSKVQIIALPISEKEGVLSK